MAQMAKFTKGESLFISLVISKLQKGKRQISVLLDTP
jgi:hypothetical protein